MEYGYTYKRGRELTEAEIYQAGVEREERLAALKKVDVNLYRDEITGEILSFCQDCLPLGPANLTYLDKAGSWDCCYTCDAQNIPTHYHGEI